MRREADDIGPTAELAYWKSRMAKFNKYVKKILKNTKAAFILTMIILDRL